MENGVGNKVTEFTYFIASPFKMTVDTSLAGNSPSGTFRLALSPYYQDPSDYEMTINWGDGTSDVITSYNQAELTHTYPSSISYQIELSGVYPAIYFNGANSSYGDDTKVTSIDQWGTNEWKSMYNAFSGCLNMVGNYIDAPNTSLVEDFSRMFKECYLFNSPVDFDTSNATSMGEMFQGNLVFDQPVNFSTSNVTYMSGMFWSCREFNQPVNFDTRNVSNTTYMFSNAWKFNQTINFDMPLVTTCQSMFFDARLFNSPVTLTNSNSLTNLNSMFRKAYAFNSPVSISNTSGVIHMSGMFWEASSFDQDVSALDPTSLCSIINCGGGASYMFTSSSLSTANYDLLLVAWDAYGTSDNKLTTVPAQYSAGAPATARANMVARGWTIGDGGQA